MLQTINLSFSYGTKEVLRDINLSLQSGEIFALIGLNGSGKSTLLRALLGLLRIQKGKILIDKKELHLWSLKERAERISLLESKPQVSFAMTVRELINLAQLQSSEPLFEEALHAVGLEGYEEKNILKLSSGEAQRAFLAHTLASGAKIIMLDEPFSHLDWSHQSELVQRLKVWNKKRGTTFLLALHELDRAVQVADRIGLMQQGKLLKVGSSSEIFSSPEIRETFAFKALIDENPLDGSKRLTLGKV